MRLCVHILKWECRKRTRQENVPTHYQHVGAIPYTVCAHRQTVKRSIRCACSCRKWDDKTEYYCWCGVWKIRINDHVDIDIGFSLAAASAQKRTWDRSSCVWVGSACFPSALFNSCNVSFVCIRLCFGNHRWGKWHFVFELFSVTNRLVRSLQWTVHSVCAWNTCGYVDLYSPVI